MTGQQPDPKVQLTRRFSRQGLPTKPEQPAPAPLVRIDVAPKGEATTWLCGRGMPPIPLDGIRMVIGRHSGCDLILPDVSISRRHAVFKARGKVVVFEDQGSRNGSCVNGEVVTKPTVLHTGDTITVGPYVFTVRSAPPRKTSGRLPALTGSLADMALSEVVQGIELHHKTCTLKVQSGGTTGFPTSRNGRPITPLRTLLFRAMQLSDEGHDRLDTQRF